jgi:hypothetical protein
MSEPSIPQRALPRPGLSLAAWAAVGAIANAAALVVFAIVVYVNIDHAWSEINHLYTHGGNLVLKHNADSAPQLADLERRVAALERQPQRPGQPSAAAAPAPRWKNRDLWRTELRYGLTLAQVRLLLGEPDKIEASSIIDTEWWYGGYPLGGHVSFDRDGHVDSWSEPPPDRP